MTIRIFVAYDVDHDQDLYKELVATVGGQSLYEVSGRSEARSDPDEWQRRAELHIAAAEQFVVVCGEHTGDSIPVSAELRIAQEQEKPLIFLWSRREAMCKKPIGALAGDPMYSWTPDVLRERLVTNRRSAKRIAVPERLKRQAPPAS